MLVISASNYPVNAGNINGPVQIDSQGTLTTKFVTGLPVTTFPLGQAETTWITVTVQVPDGGRVLAIGLLSFIGFVATSNP
jgi:hypothetical protein